MCNKSQGYYQAAPGLTEKQTQMLRLIKSNPGISLTELAKKQDTGVSMIHRRVAGLRKLGYIRPSMFHSARDLQLTVRAEQELL